MACSWATAKQDLGRLGSPRARTGPGWFKPQNPRGPHGAIRLLRHGSVPGWSAWRSGRKTLAPLAGWEIPVAEYFQTVGTRASYEYDFGDGWIHDIELEAIGRRRNAIKYPCCVDGERACPPEDCGGPGGYADLLETIADPNHEEYATTMEWLGGHFDPEAFTPRKVRFANPKTRWKIAFTERDARGGAAGSTES